ncbi:zwei Ig domain protein zig-8-like isoform X1 [Euwallacea fornicatus]|uniref:zwei Ig domain protein zig-8-like isoform X1 n=1 Tax=Euwallacea fornicatus TaxID=995702 RepID=UPI00338F3D0C
MSLVSTALAFVVLLHFPFTDAEESVSAKKFRDFLLEFPTPGTGPYFDTSVDSNITGLVGKPVLLHCRVKNLGNRTVSWVRHRDIHLLTVGRYTYTSDQRFEAIHTPHTDEWTLRIRYAQKKDTGLYECQISTTPPVGIPVYLTIVEPITEILGSPELFINMGSTINLTCIVQYAPEPPPAITWSHNSQVINFDSPRGGISLVTEKGFTTTSRLLIQKAVQRDSGLYTCAPSNANSATVRVHILNGLFCCRRISSSNAPRPWYPKQDLPCHPPTQFSPGFAGVAWNVAIRLNLVKLGLSIGVIGRIFTFFIKIIITCVSYYNVLVYKH